MSLISASGAQKKNIAINTLSANGITPQEVSVMTDVLISNLGKTGTFQVLERSKMDEILKEQGFQKSGICNESSCALEMGQLLGVELIGLGNIGLVGKTYAVSVRMVEVKTGKVVIDVNEFFKGSRDDLMTKIIPSIAQKIGLANAAKSEEKAVVQKNKGGKKGWIIAAAAVGVAAVAIPVAIILGRDDRGREDEDLTEVKVKWNQ
ncbi:MAG: hypothetical protein GX556_08245 [Fibrobacter sp.]|nr:hypothetical protein [Fibrobacter sp.]